MLARRARAGALVGVGVVAGQGSPATVLAWQYVARLAVAVVAVVAATLFADSPRSHERLIALLRLEYAPAPPGAGEAAGGSPSVRQEETVGTPGSPQPPT